MYTVVSRLDEARFREGAELLADEDPNLAQIVERWGLPEFWGAPARLPDSRATDSRATSVPESGAAMYRRMNEMLAGSTRIASSLPGRSL